MPATNTAPGRAARSAPRVAVLSIDAVGHLNPLLALVSALSGEPGRARVRAFGSPRATSLYADAGAEPRPLAFRTPAPHEVRVSGPRPSDLAVRSFLAPQEGLTEAVSTIADFEPDLVVHDVFDLRGKVAAGALGVPAVSVLPFAGLRALGAGFVEQHGAPHPALEAANDRLIRDFRTDVLGDRACLPVLFPSRALSLVTAVEAQSPPRGAPGTARLEQLDEELGAALRWTGPWLGPVHWGADIEGGFPLDRVLRRRAVGALTVLFSLGTNIATFRRGAPMGGAESGAAFFEAAVDVVLSALGRRDDVQLLLTHGGAHRDGAWPDNVLAASVLPQRRLLDGAVDVFITHHGYNSTVEAVHHGVPMVAFPGYGDQVSNAEFSVRAGVSVAHWDLRAPVADWTADTVASAVEAARAPTGPAAALTALRGELFGVDGPSAAAKLILGLL